MEITVFFTSQSQKKVIKTGKLHSKVQNIFHFHTVLHLIACIECRACSQRPSLVIPLLTATTLKISSTHKTGKPDQKKSKQRAFLSYMFTMFQPRVDCLDSPLSPPGLSNINMSPRLASVLQHLCPNFFAAVQPGQYGATRF